MLVDKHGLCAHLPRQNDVGRHSSLLLGLGRRCQWLAPLDGRVERIAERGPLLRLGGLVEVLVAGVVPLDMEGRRNLEVAALT